MYAICYHPPRTYRSTALAEVADKQKVAEVADRQPLCMRMPTV